MIARVRRARGWTQSDLAEQVGIDEETIAKVEQGRGNWRPRTARLIYDAFGAHAFNDAERALYAKSTGLTLPEPGDAPPSRPSPRNTELAGSTDHLRDLQDQTLELVGVLGYSRVKAMFAALLMPGDDDEQLLHVSEPPRQTRVGNLPAVERRIRTYATKPTPPTPAAKKRDRHA